MRSWLLIGVLAASSCAPTVDDAATPTVAVDEKALQASLDGLVEDRMVVGAVGLVAKDGEVLFRGASGFANRESGEAMTPEHLFRIASMTKAVTSVAAMILVEEGKVALDDPLSKFAPEFTEMNVLVVGDDGVAEQVPAKNAITVHHLLTHTSGFNYRFLVRDPLKKYYVEADISDGLVKTDWDLAEEARRLASVPLTHEPGEKWTYSLSTDMLGYVVQLASGQRFDEFLQERVLTPLGMRDTHFFLDERDWPRLATVYQPDGAGDLAPITGTVEDGSTHFSVDAVTHGPRVYFSGGGGLVSSIDDYFRFCQMILNGGELDGARILESETVQQMTQNQIGELSLGLGQDKFGLGFSITDSVTDGIPRGVVGWGGFYGSEYWIDPGNGVVAVLMAQVYNLARRNEIVRRFGADVFEQIASGP